MTTETAADETGTDTGAHRHGYISDKDRYRNRMKRIEGQARGITTMIDDEKYCIDILTQVAAVTKALQSLSLNLTSEHLRHCVAEAAVQAEAEGRTELIDEKVAEATAALGRLLR